MQHAKEKYEQRKKNPENLITKNNEQISLIELMYESGLEEKVIRDNISLFFIAGHETTATSLSWICSMLATNSDVLFKARLEVLEKITSPLTFDQLKELPFIEGLIKESLRLYPPVPAIGARHVEKDTVVGDVHLPAGTSISVDIISMC